MDLVSGEEVHIADCYTFFCIDGEDVQHKTSTSVIIWCIHLLCLICGGTCSGNILQNM